MAHHEGGWHVGTTLGSGTKAHHGWGWHDGTTRGAVRRLAQDDSCFVFGDFSLHLAFAISELGRLLRSQHVCYNR